MKPQSRSGGCLVAAVPKTGQDVELSKFKSILGAIQHLGDRTNATAARRIGHYRIVEKLGEGGMGAVYRAIDEMVEREVAIKVLRSAIAGTPEIAERFRTEAVALARLNHPHIATLFSFQRDADRLFMVIEYVKGQSLEAMIRRCGCLPLEIAIGVTVQVLDALKHAHSMGLLHRDVKPANILITAEGAVKVTDFGIARFLHTERMTREGSMVGTLEYMAPERILGRDADVPSDLYSAGILLFEMLTGRLPFQSHNEFELLSKHLYHAPPRMNDCGVTVPESLERILQKVLHKQPAERYDSAAAFKAGLTPFLPAEFTEDAAFPAKPVTGEKTPLALAMEATVCVPSGGFAVAEHTEAPEQARQQILQRVYMVMGALAVMIVMIAAYYGLKMMNAPVIEPSARDVIAEQPVPPASTLVSPPQPEPVTQPVVSVPPAPDSQGSPSEEESRENTEKAIRRQRALEALEQ